MKTFDPSSSDKGTDVYLLDDLANGPWGLAADDINYALQCARRITQREHSMDFYDPGYVCFDIRGYLNAKLDKVRTSQLQGKIAAVQVNDPRTFRSSATATYDTLRRQLTVEVRNDTADGPFSMVMLASAVTVDVLAVNGVTLPAPLPVTGPAIGGGITIIQGGSNTPGPPGPPGTSNPSRSYGMQPIEDSSGAETAQIQTQLYVNWAALGSSLTIRIAGTGMDDVGGGKFTLRVGGSDGGIDGTVIATLTAPSSSYTKLDNGAGTTITNPGGKSYAIMTVMSSGPGNAARLRDITLDIQSN